MWRDIRAGTCLLTGLFLGAMGGTISGQDTRADALERRRAQKAEEIAAGRAPSESPGGLERAVLFVEEGPILGWFNEEFEGFHPVIGDLVTGSGLAGGISYRYPFIGSDAVFQASANLSVERFRRVRAQFGFPTFGKVRVGVQGTYRNYPELAFFGLGRDTTLEGRTSYGIRGAELGVEATYLARPWLRGGLSVSSLRPTIGPGTEDDVPATEDGFDESSAPGVTEQPVFLTSELFLEVDFRDVPVNPRSGSFTRLAFARYRDLDLDRYHFGRTELETRHFIPYFDKRRVLVLRGRLVWSAPDAGSEIPFYLLPYVGGDDTVRGFIEYRFRDRNVLVLNVEHRWEIFSGLDMALFFDAGKVVHEPGEIDFRNLRTSKGVGFRFSTRNRFVLRVDVGTGSGEGTQVFVKFSHGF